MKVKPQSRFYRQEEFLMSSGKVIFIEVELLKFSGINKSEFPQGYQFKWLAFNRFNPGEKILFDNHEGKGPHWHENGKQEFFEWVSRTKTQQIFYQKLIEKFGNFVQRLN